MRRPNFFFAFPIDGTFVLDLPAPPAWIRLLHPEDVHLTLAFLGGCGQAAAQRALAALEQALEHRPVADIQVSLGAVVPMGRGPAYSALSALIERGREATEQCMLALRDVVSEAALGRREQRPPKAHVTIAKPRSRATSSALAAGLAWAEQLDLRSIEAPLTRLALYTWSEGSRQERLFRIIAERPLSR